MGYNYGIYNGTDKIIENKMVYKLDSLAVMDYLKSIEIPTPPVTTTFEGNFTNQYKYGELGRMEKPLLMR